MVRHQEKQNTVWLRKIFSLSGCLFPSARSIDVTLCTMTRHKVDQQRRRVANSGISTSNLSFHQTWAESVSCIDLPQTSEIRLKVRLRTRTHRWGTHTHERGTCQYSFPPTQRTCAKIKILRCVCVLVQSTRLFISVLFLQKKRYLYIFLFYLFFYSLTVFVLNVHTYAHTQEGVRLCKKKKKKSHATWPYFVSSLEMTFRVIAITAATRGFMCVCVCVCESACNDIRRSFDTPPPLSRSCGLRRLCGGHWDRSL